MINDGDWLLAAGPDHVVLLQEAESGRDTSLQSGDGDEEDEEEEPEDQDQDDDGGGWITPSNIKQVKMDSADWTAPGDVTVGCLTTDFAMQVRDAPQLGAAARRRSSAPLPANRTSDVFVSFQNVLIQIGLHVLSVSGMLIRQARSYILRCHACFK